MKFLAATSALVFGILTGSGARAEAKSAEIRVYKTR